MKNTVIFLTFFIAVLDFAHGQVITIAKDSTKQEPLLYEEYLGEKLKPIRKHVRKINRIKQWTTIKTKELNQSTESGTATYYFFKKALLKIVTIHYGESGKFIREFYTKDGKLSHVLEKTYQYNRPITWDSTAMKENNDTETFDIDKSEIIENRSFFENGLLIRQISDLDCGAPFLQAYLKGEQQRLANIFKELQNLMKYEK